GVADVQYPTYDALHTYRLPRCTGEEIIAPHAPTVELGDAFHIVTRLGIMRDTRTPRHCSRPGVISGKAQPNIATITVQQVLQVPDARVDVFLGIEWIRQLHLPRCLRHELHQSHCSLA